MSTALATTPQSQALVKASDELSLALGIEKTEMLNTIKAQCFRGSKPEDVSNAQLAAFISVANAMKVNPLLPGMLYAYPDRGAIFPIIGPDGVYKRLSESAEIESWETEVFPADPGLPPTHATTKIYRKGKEVPITYTAYFSEWRVNSNPNWNTRPRHMLGLRSLKQAARQVIHGLPGDEDDRIIMNVTESAHEEPASARQEPPTRSVSGVAAVKENKAKAKEAATAEEAPKREHGKTVDAEFTETPRDNKSDNKSAAETPKAPEPAANVEAPKLTTAPRAPVTTLKAGERLVLTAAEPSDVVKKKIKQHNDESVVIEFNAGDYIGKAYHLGGASNPAWAKLQKVNVTLVGTAQNSGAVVALVESATIADAVPAQDDELN